MIVIGHITLYWQGGRAYSLFFAYSLPPNQRNDRLPKEMGFNQVDQAFVSSVAGKRNTIPQKSLDYQTPLEPFLNYIMKIVCLA